MKIILTAVIALLFQLVLPWWSITFAAAGVAYFLYEKPAKAFLSGFLGIFLLWFTLALIINFMNDGVLAGRLANLFSLPSPYLTILITGLLGGLTGGLAALTGTMLRRASLPQNATVSGD
jgi:hypothetical protein